MKSSRDNTIAMGDCFRWAYKNVIAQGGTLVHGTVIHPWTKKPFKHAWVERDGYAYDWQTIVMRQQPPMTLRAFSKIWQPSEQARYSASKAANALLLHKHFGPWDSPGVRSCRPCRDPLLTAPQSEALAIAYENHGGVYAGWQVGFAR